MYTQRDILRQQLLYDATVSQIIYIMQYDLSECINHKMWAMEQ